MKAFLRLRSFDKGLLTLAPTQIAPKNTSIALPRKKKKFTFIRSPHIYKSSREQYEIITYSRLIDLYSFKNKKREKNKKISLDLRLYKDKCPVGVSLKSIFMSPCQSFLSNSK